MLKKGYLLSYSAYSIINSKGKFLSTRKVSENINYLKLIKSCEIGLSTVMIQNKLFNQLKFPNLKTQEDFALWLKLLRKGYKFFPIKKVLSSWRTTENSLSANKFQKLIDAFKLFYIHENKNFIYSIYCVIVLTYNKILRV
jgi:teichuronic acid biosynthesis glycosyltransferase TuaG